MSSTAHCSTGNAAGTAGAHQHQVGNRAKFSREGIMYAGCARAVSHGTITVNFSNDSTASTLFERIGKVTIEQHQVATEFLSEHSQSA